MDPTEAWYRAKKWFALYPGVVVPVSGGFLTDHYRRRRAGRGPVRALLDAAVGLGFHAWVPWRARSVAGKHGLGTDWRSNAVRIARARFADPNDIALFGIARAEQLDGYIRRFEDAGLNRLINPPAWTPTCVLADKIAFAQRCAAHHVAHPAMLAYRAGEIVVAEAAAGPVVLKPARGEGGCGVRLLTAPAADFADWAVTQLNGERGPWLIQQHVATAEPLRDIALGALPTARISTIVNEAGVPEAVNAVFRIPTDPAAAVDNMKAGGLIAPIDLATGWLGIAKRGYGGGTFETHPITGAKIAGRLLPDWVAAVALVVDAHRRAFPEYALIGWDVGFSPEGPVIIEGNGKPGVLMPQRAGGRGLGGQRYGALLAMHLARVTEP